MATGCVLLAVLVESLYVVVLEFVVNVKFQLKPSVWRYIVFPSVTIMK